MRSCALPRGWPRSARACTSVPRVPAPRPAWAGWSGGSARCIRERQAHSAPSSKLCSQRPGFRKDPGLFHCNFCGCSSVGRARPCQGRGHGFETRHPLHFGCVHALRGHATRCGGPGMCAAQGLGHVQRDTTSDGMLACGHSRSGRLSRSHAMPEQPGTSTRSRCGVEIGRNDRAAPEPVTGWSINHTRRFAMQPYDEDEDVCFHDHEQAPQGLPVRNGRQAG